VPRLATPRIVAARLFAGLAARNRPYRRQWAEPAQELPMILHLQVYAISFQPFRLPAVHHTTSEFGHWQL
jgi:hypothetical protein